MYDGQGFRVAVVLIMAAQTAIMLLPQRLGVKYRFALAVAAFPLVGAAVGAIYGWVLHYWS